MVVWKNDFFALRHGRSIANEQQLIVSRPPLAVAEYGLSEAGKAQAAAVRIPPPPTTPAAKNPANAKDVADGADDAGVVVEEECDRPVILIASDFRRAVETAEIVQRTILTTSAPKTTTTAHEDEQEGRIPRRTRPVRLHYDVRLRERDFGRYDLTSDANYHIVWAHDVATAGQPEETTDDDSDDDDGVESVESVLRRGRECMQEWNDVYDNCYIVLVAHGDVLQILQTSFTDDESYRGIPMAPHQHRSLPHLETAVPRLLVRRRQLRRDEKVVEDNK